MNDDFGADHMMLQEREDHAELLFRIECQAEQLREIAVLEDQVDRRKQYEAKHGKGPMNEQFACLASLAAHAVPPQISNNDGERTFSNVKRRSEAGKHRKMQRNDRSQLARVQTS